MNRVAGAFDDIFPDLADGKPKRQRRRRPVPSPDATQHTDVGNGHRLAAKHGSDFRHCHPWKKDLVWDGLRWRMDDTAILERWAKAVVKGMYAEAAVTEDEGHRTRLAAWALRSENAQRIRAMMAMARSEEAIPILPAELDRDPWLFNCSNGTLDLRSGKLRKHCRADFISKLCPVAYDPNAPAPLWERFLKAIFDKNESLITYIRRLFGYCLTGSVAEQVLPILWGVGANGKSTLVGTILAMLGEDYAIKAAADLIMVKRGDSHPTERADLAGKRLVICLETEEGRRLAESLAKDLTGGDRQRARRMREDFWEFTPSHKILLTTNHKPQIKGTDHAIWRRVRLIPFTVCIPDDKQDKQLPEKLRAELPGILTWCVRGCREWQKQGLGLPEEIEQATSEYRTTQDVLGGFLAECCLTGPNYTVKAKQVYEGYLEWAKRSGEEPVSQRRFGESMTERGYERKENHGIWYVGIGMRPDLD